MIKYLNSIHRLSSGILIIILMSYWAYFMQDKPVPGLQISVLLYKMLHFQTGVLPLQSLIWHCSREFILIRFWVIFYKTMIQFFANYWEKAFFVTLDKRHESWLSRSHFSPIWPQFRTILKKNSECFAITSYSTTHIVCLNHCLEF